jgi:TolA-binding protein
MKKLLIVMFCVGSITVNTPAIALNATTVTESSSHSVFTGLFRSVWAHLKSLNPTQRQSAKSTRTYVTGIRGAESTDTLLQPYWKADLTQDESFQAELEKFSLAQHQMDKGDLPAAVALFDDFLSEYAQSDMRPNALFGKSVSLASIGQSERSLVVMHQFINENPNHPLVGDARQVIEALQ